VSGDLNMRPRIMEFTASGAASVSSTPPTSAPPASTAAPATSPPKATPSKDPDFWRSKHFDAEGKLLYRDPGYWGFRYFRDQTGKVHAGFVANCPCGCGQQDIYLPLVRDPAEKQSNHDWVWDGNEDAPTLAPSIRRNSGCRAHFHLEGGVYKMHADGAPAAPDVYRFGHTPQRPVSPQTRFVAGEGSFVARNPENVSPRSPAVSKKPSRRKTAEAKEGAEPAPEVTPPTGWMKTIDLRIIDGKLHQRWESPHPGENDEHWQPIDEYETTEEGLTPAEK
jgi:hypothetical protein